MYLATPYAADRHAGPRAIGLLLAAAALGSILAEVLGARLRIATRPRLVLPVALITGTGLVLYAFRPPIVVAVAINLVAALGGAIGQRVDAQLLAALPDHLRGQLLSLQGGFMMAAQGLGIAGAGALAEVLAPHQVVAAAGVLALVTPLVLLRRASGQAADAEGRPVRGVAALERL